MRVYAPKDKKPTSFLCNIVDCDRPARATWNAKGNHWLVVFKCQGHLMRKRRTGSFTARTCCNRDCQKIVDSIHDETHIITGHRGHKWLCNDCIVKVTLAGTERFKAWAGNGKNRQKHAYTSQAPSLAETFAET